MYCKLSNQKSYPFTLPDLPYLKNAFAPYFTSETFDYHHGKHHQTYVTNLNDLLKDEPELQKKTLEELILIPNGVGSPIFNNAAQIWNHTFFWHSIKPQGGGRPTGKLLAQIEQDFGGFEKFCELFTKTAISQFGSGWTWLVKQNNKLQVIKTPNAETPLTQSMQPLIACDVWEHVYYIDYRNKRLDYVNTYIERMINWKFAEEHYQKV